MMHEPPIGDPQHALQATDAPHHPGLSAHLAGWKRLEDVEPSDTFRCVCGSASMAENNEDAARATRQDCRVCRRCGRVYVLPYGGRR